ncbi:MAG: hypothetical protein U0610_06845 [bacterium]
MTSNSARSTALVLEPLGKLARGAVERASTLAPVVPRRLDEYAARLWAPWHVRTLILPLPGAGDVELLFTNLIVGRVGVMGFDDDPPRTRTASDARDEGHLALLALGGGASVAQTLLFSRRQHVRTLEDGFRVEVPDSFALEIRGRWPDYQQQLVVPSAELELELRVRCLPPARWWAYAPRVYVHHSGFGEATGSVVVRGRRTAIQHPVSLEPATGRNLLGLPGAPRVPATVFHYQLGTLPGAGTFAIGCFRLGAFEPFRAGELVLPDGRHERLVDWDMSVDETSWITARAGGPIEVPSRFTVRARGETARLEYSAVRDWPVIAQSGRLTASGARIRGRLWVAGHSSEPVDGVVYEEHLQAPGVKQRATA